jgi:hypothetical protein
VEGPDTRFIVTNLKVRNARVLYEDVYCRRGQAENHIKSWKTHLAADRTSCTGQPAPAVPARRRILAHVGSARVDASALDVARRAVRYVAPAAHQGRCSRRRDEDDDQDSPADVVPRPAYFASRARAYPAPRHLSDGAQRPECRARSVNPQNILHPAFWLDAGEDAVRPRAAKPETITRARWRARRNRQSAA